MTEEEAMEAARMMHKVKITFGARTYVGNLFLGNSNDSIFRYFRFVGKRSDKPSEEVVAIVPFEEVFKLSRAE
jgi:hypothetical protein